MITICEEIRLCIRNMSVTQQFVSLLRTLYIQELRQLFSQLESSSLWIKISHRASLECIWKHGIRHAQDCHKTLERPELRIQ